jgi:hypothetical protein
METVGHQKIRSTMMVSSDTVYISSLEEAEILAAFYDLMTNPQILWN